MATVRLNCPHCARTDRLSISEPLDYYSEASRASWLADLRLGTYNYDAIAGMECHLCGGWSVGVFSVDGDDGYEVLNTGPKLARPVESSGGVEFLVAFPSPPDVIIHEAVPEAAATFFVEAKEDLVAGRSAAGIISKCRSVLDLCLKELKAVGPGRKARIADLRSKGLLTQGLADWADHLWDDGNDAIHDLRGDCERAKQHVTFLELFFQITFALPAQVNAAQTQKVST